MAREGVRVPHIMGSVVKNIDMRETNDPDDKQTERQSENRLSKPAGGSAAGKRHMGRVGLCHVRFSSFTADYDTSFRATSRLVR